MPNNLAVSVIIGAAISGTFHQILGNAKNKLSTLDTQVKSMDGRMSALQGFQAAEHDLSKAANRFQQARERVSELRREIQGSSAPTKKMSDALRSAQSTAAKARNTFDEKRRTLASTRTELGRLGLSYRNIAGQSKELGEATKTLQLRHQQLSTAMAKGQAIRHRRQVLRGEMMDAVGLAMALRAPISAAMDIESAEVRLRTVIASDDVDAAMSAARSHALEWGRSNPTNATDMLGINYALSSAGFDAAAARFGSGIVARVATATDGQAEEVGELIGVVYNNLGKSMDGGMEEKLTRIGDVLVQTQNAFQLRDFGQLAESMKVGAAAAIRYKVPLDQTAAVLGQFNSAGLMGGRAGTAMNAVLRQMGKASDDFGFAIERSADGSMDLISTLANLQEALDIFDDPDEQASALQETFGDQGANVVLLLENIEALNTQYKKLRDNADGATNRSYETRIASTSSKMKMLRNRVTEAGVAIGSVLLPGVNMVGAGLGWIATGVAKFAARFPILSKVVVGLTAGLIAGKIAAIGIGYALTFVTGAVTSAITGFRLMQTAYTLLAMKQKGLLATTIMTNDQLKVMGAAGRVQAAGAALANFARGGVTIAMNAMRALNLSLLMSPIGWIALGIAGAAVLIYKYWQPISAYFKGLWSGIKAGFEPLKNVFAPVIDAVKPLFSWLGNLLSPIDATGETLDRVSGIGEKVGYVIGTVLGGAIRWVTLPFRLLMSVVSGAVEVLKGAFRVFKFLFDWSPLGLLIRGFSAARNWLSSIDWSETGRAILGTLADGIKSMAMAPVDAVRGVLGKVRELLPFSDAKTGPLSDLTASGASIPGTLAAGAQGAENTLKQSLSGILGRAWMDARDMMSGNVDIATKIGQALAPARHVASAGIMAAGAVIMPGIPAAASSPPVTINNHYEITVQASPGMDVHELAILIQRKIAEAEDDKARRRRGQLYDGTQL